MFNVSAASEACRGLGEGSSGSVHVRPFFIVSSGRSGTTLLASLLNATGRVMIPPESHFIARAYPFYARKVNFTKGDYADAVALFMRTSQMNGWGLSESELRSTLERECPQSFCDINSRIYEEFLGEHGAGHTNWGIKAPALIASLNRILRVFPDALVLHLVRDGRDVCLSYLAVNEMGENFGPSGVLSSSLYWVDGLRRVEWLRNRSNCFEVRYEDLLANTDETLRRVGEYLGIDTAENGGAGARAGSMMISEHHRKTIHKKVGQAVDGNNYGKYRKAMPRASIFLFEMLAAPYLSKYGYEVTYPMLGSRVFGVIRQPMYLLARLYNNVRYGLRDVVAYGRARRMRAPLVAK